MMKNGVYFTRIALLVAELYLRFWFMQIRRVTSQKEDKVVQNHKKIENLCKY